jgi:predicted ATPase
MSDAAVASGFPRLTYLRIKNYRALRDVELRDLTPLTVLIGPNGSGKSTILDALAFLAEAVSGNLQQAWEKRNRFAGMRTRGQDGPIEFEIKALIETDVLIFYRLSVDEYNGSCWVVNEELEQLSNKETQKIFQLVSRGLVRVEDDRLRMIQGTPPNNYETFHRGIKGFARAASKHPWLFHHSSNAAVVDILEVESILPELRFAKLLKSYRYIHLTDDHLKGYSDAGPREKLSANGDNLPNVLYYLHQQHPEALTRITAQLRRWVPQLAEVVTEITSDERLLLRFKDAPFEKLLPAQYMSDGTMRLAALLTLLYEPNATGLLGIEEPENELHPRLLPRLAEELIKATETRQLLVATHSPFLLDALEPEQVWILHRGPDGYTQATRTADIPQVKELVEDGSPLGYLWTSNFFRLGDPLMPRTPAAQ